MDYSVELVATKLQKGNLLAKLFKTINLLFSLNLKTKSVMLNAYFFLFFKTNII